MAINVEAQLISAIINERDLTSAMGQGVSPDMFHQHDDVWKWLETYYGKYKRTPSKDALKAAFPEFVIRRGADDVKHFADEVRKAHSRTLMLGMMKDAADALADGDVELAVKIAGSSIVTIAAAMGTNNDSDIFTDYTDVVNDVENRVRRVQEHGAAGIPFGVPGVDRRTGGANPGELVVVGGRLGHGKSWFLQSFAAKAALEGYTVQFDALEQSRSQVSMRIQALMAGTLGKQVFSNTMLTQGQGFKLSEYKSFLRKLKNDVAGRLHVSDTTRGRVGLTTVQAQIERNKPDIVFIDYLTLMSRTNGDWQGIAELTGGLKAIATNYQIPIVVAGQLNRTDGIVSRKSEPPGMEAFFGADAIGQDADKGVTFVKKTERVLHAKMAKDRNGPDGYMFWIHFEPEKGIFKEISANDAVDLMSQDDDNRDKQAVQ